MKIYLAAKEQIPAIVDISQRAFDSDVLVGNDKPGGPPNYCDEKWHEEMRKKGIYTPLKRTSNL